MSNAAGPVKTTPCETTDGALLDGRLRYRQFRDGYRSGIEPVLLAAAVPARPGERVLEAGCGAGAAMMCLCARVAGLKGIGIELDAATAELARYNFCSNGMAGVAVYEAALPELPPAIGRFDHAFANPPWHRANASASPVARRDLARRAASGFLEQWVLVLAALLRPGGSLTLILPASLHALASATMQSAGIGGITLLPCWPKPGIAAKIVLLQGRSGSRSDACVLPGLMLHQADGSYTEAASRILRLGEALGEAQHRKYVRRHSDRAAHPDID